LSIKLMSIPSSDKVRSDSKSTVPAAVAPLTGWKAARTVSSSALGWKMWTGGETERTPGAKTHPPHRLPERPSTGDPGSDPVLYTLGSVINCYRSGILLFYSTIML
jgi:hypothetical protein